MNPKNIFGVDLAEQMQRDGHEVPLILVKCCEAIEQSGKFKYLCILYFVWLLTVRYL
jgi:hypothetical protein